MKETQNRAVLGFLLVGLLCSSIIACTTRFKAHVMRSTPSSTTPQGEILHGKGKAKRKEQTVTPAVENDLHQKGNSQAIITFESNVVKTRIVDSLALTGIDPPLISSYATEVTKSRLFYH